MATKKSSASISKHKTATTHKAATKSPQAFDIIPRSQVRPQSSARPVIMSSQPMVADNTLTSPSAAPALQLKHRPVTVNPPKDSELVKEVVTIPKEAGVSVADLIAKRSEKAKEETPQADTLTNGKATEDELKRALEEPSTDRTAPEASDDEPKLPPVEPMADDDKPAEIEKVPDTATDTTVSPSEDKTPTDIEDNESLQKVLNGTTSTTQTAPLQEHSQALKDAMKDMGGDGERPHHELYGGKPVIVVHKDHSMSGLAWVLWFLVCVGLALLIVNFLLDADIIQTTYNVPHTDLL